MSTQIPRLAVVAFVGAVVGLQLAAAGPSSAGSVRAAADGSPSAAARLADSEGMVASLVAPHHFRVSGAESVAGSAAAADVAARSAVEELVPPEPPRPPGTPRVSALVVVPPPPPPPVVVVPPPDPATFVVDESVWDALAQCESSGNWAINTGNGYYGGLQFSYETWHGYGGGAYAEYPHQATREQQIAIAEKLHAARGFQPWPACRIELGLP